MDHSSRRAGRSRSKGVVFSAAAQGPPKQHKPKVATACLVVVSSAATSRHRTSKAPNNLPQQVYLATPSRIRLSKNKSLLLEVFSVAAKRIKPNNKTLSSPRQVEACLVQASRPAMAQCSEELVAFLATAQHSSHSSPLATHCSVA